MINQLLKGPSCENCEDRKGCAALTIIKLSRKISVATNTVLSGPRNEHKFDVRFVRIQSIAISAGMYAARGYHASGEMLAAQVAIESCRGRAQSPEIYIGQEPNIAYIGDALARISTRLFEVN
jgi:hypothetical protein